MYFFSPVESTPSVLRIVRDAIANAPHRTRASFMSRSLLWLLLMVLQAWDSAQRSGPAAVAEFLSALCGSAGGVLLALSGVINAGAERTAGTRRNRRGGEAFRRALIALPAVGLAAGVLLSAAVALMAVRALLGTPVPFVVVMTTLFGRDVVAVGRDGDAAPRERSTRTRRRRRSTPRPRALLQARRGCRRSRRG